MQKCLYLLCPTDCLESIINETFRSENYFYSSLGNSFVCDIEAIKGIKDIIEKYHINEIYFILSQDNQIVLDALGNQIFSDIKGLNRFYIEMNNQFKVSNLSGFINDNQFSVISYYLNKKIKELDLRKVSNIPIKISAKIYNRQQKIFTNIFSELICLKKYNLN